MPQWVFQSSHRSSSACYLSKSSISATPIQASPRSRTDCTISSKARFPRTVLNNEGKDNRKRKKRRKREPRRLTELNGLLYSTYATCNRNRMLWIGSVCSLAVEVWDCTMHPQVPIIHEWAVGQSIGWDKLHWAINFALRTENVRSLFCGKWIPVSKWTNFIHKEKKVTKCEDVSMRKDTCPCWRGCFLVAYLHSLFFFPP